MRLRAALAAAVALLAAPAAAHGDVGFRPDGASGVAFEGGYLKITAVPGGTAGGSFVVTNSGGTAADLQIYAADGLTGTTTGVVFGSEGARADGRWITPGRASATLAPGAELPLPFSVRVPSGALPGDHVAGVVLQQRRSGASINQVVRNVVPILVSVPGGAGPQIRLGAISIGTLPGTSQAAVTIGLRNDGNRMCRPRLSVDLVGGRETGQPVTRQLDMVLPGDAVPYPMPWPRTLTAGSYKIRVTASGCGATQSDVVTGTTGPAADDVTSTTPATTTPRAPTPDGAAGSSPPRRAPVPAGSGGSGLGNRINVTPVPVPGADAAGAGARPVPAAVAQDDGVVDKVRGLLRDHAADVLERASLPMAILLMLGIAVVAQEAIDRRDPKLALAPVHGDPDLPFDHDPEQ